MNLVTVQQVRILDIRKRSSFCNYRDISKEAGFKGI